MTKILAIETATKNCSVALFENEKLIGCREEGGQYSHAEKLAVFIDELLKEKGLTYQDLNAVAVSKGPGSYTGLRIWVSLAKGLCYGLGIPLIGIDTLKHMAWGLKEEVKQEEALYCSMIDARRMEVYSAIYDFHLNPIKSISADVIEEGSYQKLLSENKVYFFGDGALKCQETLKSENAIFLDRNLPTASMMGELAYSAFKSEQFEDTAYFEPFYLKDFIAHKAKNLL